MSARQRVLLLLHPYFHPDRRRTPSRTEKDVWLSLKRLGHACEISTAQNDLADLDRDLARHRPHVVFNLLEEFRDEGIYDFHVVAYLEAKGVPFTGCNPRGMILTRNKLWTSGVARGAAVRAPRSWLASALVRAAKPPFPLILKFNNEHASMGMTRKNLARNPRELRACLERMSEHDAEVVAQEFIVGREVSVAVAGNRKPASFHPRELRFPSLADFATERVKFSAHHRRRQNITARDFTGDEGLARDLRRASARLFSRLNLSGYARFDYRLDRKNNFYLIDVNANPNLARDEDFALSARRAGLSYEELVRRIIRLARGYSPAR